MLIAFILAGAFALLEGLALWKTWPRLAFVAKPAVMICLLAALYLATGFQGLAFWFAVGLGASLAGDVFLLFPQPRMFLFGLGAFLAAHLAYLGGLESALATSGVAALLPLLALLPLGLWVARRLVRAIRARGEGHLVPPVIAYAVVITLMWLAALSTLFPPGWRTPAALLVATGAGFFYLSDVILAWNKFITIFRRGHVANLAAYHLGQGLIIAGVILQAAPASP